MNRRCARPQCNGIAVATMAFDYDERLVWMDYLTAEPEPMTLDLCALHADGLTVPVGWRLDSRLLRVEDLYSAQQAS